MSSIVSMIARRVLLCKGSGWFAAAVGSYRLLKLQPLLLDVEENSSTIKPFEACDEPCAIAFVVAVCLLRFVAFAVVLCYPLLGGGVDVPVVACGSACGYCLAQ